MRTVRTIESPRGKGELWDKERKVATVDYSLNVVQLGPEENALRQIDASITVLEGIHLLELKEMYTLRMQDGRKIKCFIERMDLMSRDVHFRVTGTFF